MTAVQPGSTPALTDRHRALRRNFLDRLAAPTVESRIPLGDLALYRIRGLTDFWTQRESDGPEAAMADLLAGLAVPDAIFAYVLIGLGAEIHLYAGVRRSMGAALATGLAAAFPRIELWPTPTEQVQAELRSTAVCGGLVTGYPTGKGKAEGPCFQVDRLCAGLLGYRWAYMVLASQIGSGVILEGRERLLQALTAVSPFLVQTTTPTAVTEQTRQVTNFAVQDYVDDLKSLVEKLQACQIRGGWNTVGYYGAPDETAAVRVGNLIRAVYGGAESRPELLRCIPMRPGSAADLMPNFKTTAAPAPDAAAHPAFRIDAYRTVLPSEDLAALAHLPRQEHPGCYLGRYVEFDLDEREARSGPSLTLGSVAVGATPTPNGYHLPVSDLTRHGLIAGVTGSGKTNTAKQLLVQLWTKYSKPFLVIESAKKEYWELAGLEQDGLRPLAGLRVFTPGDEQGARYRINPFEPVPGAPLQTHVDYLLAAFKASFDLFPPLPHVLETCVYEVYADCGWQVATSENALQRTDYPTLDDLYNKIDVVLNRLAYDARVKSDLSAALRARVGSLLVGSKQALLNTPQSVPIEWLLQGPAVVELEELGDDEVKAFVIGLLLVQLYEHRKLRGGSHNQLEHVLLIEEAHRLLRHVPDGGSEQANPRQRAVEFFCNLLAEVRSYGQGILIADQIPTKLASDTLRNTNLKIAHRIVVREDREAMGHAMNMTDDQVAHLSVLPRGLAAIYAEGDHRPKLVRVEPLPSTSRVDRKAVLGATSAEAAGLGCYSLRYHSACPYCREVCRHRERILTWQREENLHPADVERAVRDLAAGGWQAEAVQQKLDDLQNAWGDAVRLTAGVRLCLLGFWLGQVRMPEQQRREHVAAYVRRCAAKGGSA